MSTMQGVRIELSLVAGTTLAVGSPDCASLRGRRFEQTLPDLSPGVIQALERLEESAASEEELGELVMACDGLNGVLALRGIIYQLDTLGALTRTVSHDGVPLASHVAMNSGRAFQDDAAAPDQPYVLSRFAYLRRVRGAMELECPLGAAKLVCLDRRACEVVAALARPASPADVAEHCGGLPHAAILALFTFLVNARAVEATRDGAALDEDAPAHPLGGWEFHDLVFHTRSRFGRHDNPYGGTFHMKGRVAPPALAAPRPWAHDIDLTAAALQTAGGGDAPFSEIVRRRRSVRTYAMAPIDLRALAAFLDRVARVQKVLKLPEGEMDLSLRPCPGGGAIHELELYPVIGQCDGLTRGIYHYDPFSHRLGRVPAEDRAIEQLLEIAWQTADRKSRPQVYFVVTARFARMQWKYQSVAYAVILKNVGVLYEAMYLAATALGLAPCALGGGPSDLFCTATGLDFYEESQVGEFMLGSLGAGA